MKQSQRLDKIPPYLFAEIDRKIAEAKAKGDRKSTRLNSSHTDSSRMPSSA